MWITKLKTIVGLGMTVALLGWFLYQTLATPAESRPGRVLLPTDPQQVVLHWESIRPELPRVSETPQLIVRADGTVQASDPYGPGRPAQIQLSNKELQEVLQFIVHEQGFFGLDESRVRSQIDAERQRRGLAGRALDRLPIAIVRVSADEREQEIRCADLQACAAGDDANRLLAIERRLERLAIWTHAGGHAGVSRALQIANDQLRRQFPEAPLLTADDLRSAKQTGDGVVELTLERRGVAGNGKTVKQFVHCPDGSVSEQAVDRPYRPLTTLPQYNTGWIARAGTVLCPQWRPRR
jgi:hypothetical protein